MTYVTFVNNNLFSYVGSSTKSLQNGTNGKSHQNGTITSTQSQLPQPKKILFPRENVQIGWRMNLSCSGRKWGPGCGFRNVGNTCYLNSALQAFIHVPAIAQWLMSDREHRENECGRKLYFFILLYGTYAK